MQYANAAFIFQFRLYAVNQCILYNPKRPCYNVRVDILAQKHLIVQIEGLQIAEHRIVFEILNQSA